MDPKAGEGKYNWRLFQDVKITLDRGIFDLPISPRLLFQERSSWPSISVKNPGLSLFSTLEEAPIVSILRFQDLPFFFTPLESQIFTGPVYNYPIYRTSNFLLRAWPSIHIRTHPSTYRTTKVGLYSNSNPIFDNLLIKLRRLEKHHFTSPPGTYSTTYYRIISNSALFNLTRRVD